MAGKKTNRVTNEEEFLNSLRNKAIKSVRERKRFEKENKDNLEYIRLNDSKHTVIIRKKKD